MKSDPEQPDETPKESADTNIWTIISVVALIGTGACIIVGQGDSAIACAILFATSIYAFHNEI